MTKVGDHWYDADGQDILPHLFDWGESEPSNEERCVIADRQIG